MKVCNCRSWVIYHICSIFSFSGYFHVSNARIKKELASYRKSIIRKCKHTFSDCTKPPLNGSRIFTTKKCQANKIVACAFSIQFKMWKYSAKYHLYGFIRNLYQPVQYTFLTRIIYHEVDESGKNVILGQYTNDQCE